MAKSARNPLFLTLKTRRAVVASNEVRMMCRPARDWLQIEHSRTVSVYGERISVAVWRERTLNVPCVFVRWANREATRENATLRSSNEVVWRPPNSTAKILFAHTVRHPIDSTHCIHRMHCLKAHNAAARKRVQQDG